MIGDAGAPAFDEPGTRNDQRDACEDREPSPGDMQWPLRTGLGQRAHGRVKRARTPEDPPQQPAKLDDMAPADLAIFQHEHREDGVCHHARGQRPDDEPEGGCARAAGEDEARGDDKHRQVQRGIGDGNELLKQRQARIRGVGNHQKDPRQHRRGGDNDQGVDVAADVARRGAPPGKQAQHQCHAQVAGDKQRIRDVGERCFLVKQRRVIVQDHIASDQERQGSGESIPGADHRWAVPQDAPEHRQDPRGAKRGIAVDLELLRQQVKTCDAEQTGNQEYPPGVIARCVPPSGKGRVTERNGAHRTFVRRLLRSRKSEPPPLARASSDTRSGATDVMVWSGRVAATSAKRPKSTKPRNRPALAQRLTSTPATIRMRTKVLVLLGDNTRGMHEGAMSEQVVPRYEPSATPAVLLPPLLTGAIPCFPEFKPLAWSDRPLVGAWVDRFPPYSDFNFLLMWCWHGYLGTELGWLHGNLVMRFADYSSGERASSLIGVNRVAEAVEALLDDAACKGLAPRLRLVPEIVVAADRRLGQRFFVAEDGANVDHILSTEAWSTLAGGKFRNKRHVIRQLRARHAVEARVVSLADPGVRAAMLRLFDEWIARQPCPEAARHELHAFNRLLVLGDDPRLMCLGLEVDGVLRGFTVNELLPGGYAMGHFMKADLDLPGCSSAVLQATCQELLRRGYPYLNIMQDLGDPGIAHAKRLCRPVHGLRKYTIAPRASQAVS
ncbi:MAG: hypothetical protein C4346_11840 [Chloroflexota bacterium]